jgi:hypothetical protein
MGRAMLDRTKNQFSHLDREALIAAQPADGCELQDFTDWLIAMGKFRARIQLPWSHDLASDYSNFGSADCDGGL